MNPTGAVVLVVTLVLAAGVGLWLRSRDGRIREAATARGGGWEHVEHDPSDDTHRVLLLQLSSPVCTPCRRTAEVLTELAGRRPDLLHRELDVADRPDVARELGVMRTPTVVAFARDGAELLRVSGVPKVAELEASLDAHLP